MPVIEGPDRRQCGRCSGKRGWRFRDGCRCTGAAITRADFPPIVRIDYWVDDAGRKVRACPFLFRSPEGFARCAIHMTEPRVCVGFTPWDEPIRDYAHNVRGGSGFENPFHKKKKKIRTVFQDDVVAYGLGDDTSSSMTL
ncbi:MAG: hypothetical protein WC342_01825 [Methanoregula sp.]|jgi:Fe-S-cluster containining protein